MVRTSLTTESGLGLIEVMIASLVVTVSLLAIAMAMTAGVYAILVTQEQLVAKQKAKETLESVFASRSTTDLEFKDLNSKTDGGIFVEGWQPLYGMGADGIALTDDDDETPVETINFVGPDGVLGTDDDDVRQLKEFQRRVAFTPVLLSSGSVDEDIRMITVEVRFKSHQRWMTVSVHSYLSRFS